MTHYEQLGVPRSATRHEIHAAYRAMVKHHHPDLGAGSAGRIAALNEAWRVLSDDTLRARYDASLLLQTRVTPPRPAPERAEARRQPAPVPRARPRSVVDDLDDDPDYRPLTPLAERRLNLMIRAVAFVGCTVLAVLAYFALSQSG